MVFMVRQCFTVTRQSLLSMINMLHEGKCVYVPVCEKWLIKKVCMCRVCVCRTWGGESFLRRRVLSLALILFHLPPA